jgi:serine/threonine protein phosphatase PrpC
MKLISSGKTDKGKTRTNNEDAFLVNDLLGLYAVADGIGGHEGGEVASRLAVEALSSMLREQFAGGRSAAAFNDSPEADQYIISLRGAAAFANATIHRVAAEDPALTGMGTTMTAVLLRPRTSFFAHAGDSRAYLFRDGTLRQLTDDHSLVAEQMRAGLITPEQARMSPYRHVITRSFGIHQEVHADLGMFEVDRDDILLLCTDGLTEMVNDDDIARILGSEMPPASAESLIRLANDNGGVDNVTVVVVRIDDI